MGTVPAGHFHSPLWQIGDFATSVHGVKPPSGGPFVMTQLGTGMPQVLVPEQPAEHAARRMAAKQATRIEAERIGTSSMITPYAPRCAHL